MKKWIGFVLVVMICMLCAIGAIAEELTWENWTYRMEPNGICVTEYKAVVEDNAIFVPYKIEGQRVIGFDMNLIKNQNNKNGFLFIPSSVNMYFHSEEQTLSLDWYLFTYIDSDFASDNPNSVPMSPPSDDEIFLNSYWGFMSGYNINSNITVDYKDIPKQVNNKRILFQDDTGITKYNSGDFEYIMLTDNTIRITKHKNESSKVVRIPAELDGFTVTEIGAVGFWGNVIYSNNVEQLDLPDTLTKLGNYAIRADRKSTRLNSSH